MSSPFERPLVRHGVGFLGAVTIAAVAFFFLEGTIQLVAYGVAVLDAIVTPQVLRISADSGADG
jgi:hypothetical protein